MTVPPHHSPFPSTDTASRCVAALLEEHRYQPTPFPHVRLDRKRDGDFPVWLFGAEGLTFDLTVLPLDALRQAPLSGVDEKPMRRASLANLQQLIADEEISAHVSRAR